MKQLVLSGIQPTGTPHIGNYFGALKQWVALQDEYQCSYCVVDLHALTVKQDPSTFASQSFETAATLLALGVDPDRSTLFIQSQVPQHTELSWVLTTLTPMGELERMTQYKEKSGQHKTNINAGLFAYPILMAADILVYKAGIVPVGEDQVQHVELARVLARKCNKAYGSIFPEPKPMLTKSSRIMSLVDPAKKMSKSHGEKSYIALTDDPKTIAAKLAKAVTATSGGSKTHPGVRNLFAIMREVSDESTIKTFEEAEASGSIRYGDFKKQLAADLAEHLAPFRERRAALLKQPNKIREILEEGRRKATSAASATMDEVRKAVGLYQ